MLPCDRDWTRLLVLLTLCGCAMPKPPGELVGSYSVQGALTKNECGRDALPAADPLLFDVEIRHEDQAGYWLQGMPPAFPGHYGDDGAFAFELESTYDVDAKMGEPLDALSAMDSEALANPATYDALQAPAAQPCILRVVERIAGQVLASAGGNADAGAGDAVVGAEMPRDLVADNDISISAMSGGDCARVLHANGGPFAALPCGAHYDLVGTIKGARE